MVLTSTIENGICILARIEFPNELLPQWLLLTVVTTQTNRDAVSQYARQKEGRRRISFRLLPAFAQSLAGRPGHKRSLASIAADLLPLKISVRLQN